MPFTLLVSFSAQTEKGSALHEAALYGKTDVVQRLLSAGQTSAQRRQMFESLAAVRKNPRVKLDCYLHQTLPVVTPARCGREHRRPEGPDSAGHCQGHALPEEQRDSGSHSR